MFVKVCGNTSEDDALLAVAMGADAVGFIFAPSPRQISPSLAGDIVKRLPQGILTVGVFRDEVAGRVVSLAQEAGVQAVQLHGRETPEDARWIRQRVGMLIKAFPAGDAKVLRAGEYGADTILLDAAEPGSGEVFDWALASEVPDGQRLMIAGGLDTSNVAAAIAQTQPWGVDVASGVERSPGRKDPKKLREFIAAAKAASPERYEPGDDGPYDWQQP